MDTSSASDHAKQIIQSILHVFKPLECRIMRTCRIYENKLLKEAQEAGVYTFRLPSILAVVGLKKSCMANLR